jgi:alanine dehydrogenase
VAPPLLLLDPAGIAGRLDPDTLIAALAAALADLSAGRAEGPPRIAVRSPAGLLAAMPGRAAGLLGAKLVTVFPDNHARGLPGHQAVVALFDANTGALRALVDGAAITAARTAAVSAVATRLLARRDARVLAILGTSVQADAHARIVRRVRDFAEVRLAGRRPERARACAAACNALPFDTIEAAVRGADVVCCCTHAAEPVLRRAWLAPGAHVNSVGIGGHELDRDTLLAGRLAVETRAAFLPFPSGAFELQGLDPAAAVELGELLAGARPGRADDAQITVFKSVGHAVEDIAAAALLLAPQENC